jgi:hypothetical protein
MLAVPLRTSPIFDPATSPQMQSSQYGQFSLLLRNVAISSCKFIFDPHLLGWRQFFCDLCGRNELFAERLGPAGVK